MSYFFLSKPYFIISSLKYTTLGKHLHKNFTPSTSWVNIFLPSHIQWIYSLNSLNASTVKWKTFDSSHITMNMSYIKKSNNSTMEEINKGNLTQWGSHIMRSILMSHIMVIKNPQNVHKICLQLVLMTFICDIKIGIIMYEPHCVQLLFCEPLYSSCLTFWHLTAFWQFDIFLTFWHWDPGITEDIENKVMDLPAERRTYEAKQKRLCTHTKYHSLSTGTYILVNKKEYSMIMVFLKLSSWVKDHNLDMNSGTLHKHGGSSMCNPHHISINLMLKAKSLLEPLRTPLHI